MSLGKVLKLVFRRIVYILGFIFRSFKVAPTTFSDSNFSDGMAARKILDNTITRKMADIVLPRTSPRVTSKTQTEEKDGPESPKPAKKYMNIKNMPGPWPSLPIIGTSWQYLPGGRYNLTNVYETQEDKYRRYGPIIREEFQWGKPVVHLFEPDDFETVFKYQGRYPIRRISDFLVHYRRNRPEKYSSAGLANTEGDEWERLRKIIAPVLLKPKAIQFLLPSMSRVGDDFVDLLRSVRNPDTFVIENLSDVSYRLALEGVYMMSLDTRLGCLDPDLENNTAAADMILSVKLLFESFQELFYGLPLWKVFETASYKKLDKAESLMYEACSRQIGEAVEKLRNSDDDEEGVLRTLIRTNKLDDKELIVSVIDLISGGIFTVANTFCFLVYHIARNPEVQEKLYEELRTTMPDPEISADRLAKMPYLKACIKEAFRLTPTIPCINRILTKDAILSGYHIPAGTEVFCNFPIPCMQADKFPDPQKFYPDRWVDRDSLTHNPYTMMPFGFGVRMCIGRRFAEMEMYTALAKLVYNFKLEYAGEDLKLKSAFIIVPGNPISVVLRDR
ncbi:ecdysone 20-monooxygenase [Nephila pilipes]|uniref:Ecdysone 20-monooxygenase n=1 Tax=Nephila pilipes TaxID=299642 RepID=A0A8X6Q8Y7_NEPPI|nr:ecdysone 20-monooxygenase [Nephila pilipes]